MKHALSLLFLLSTSTPLLAQGAGSLFTGSVEILPGTRNAQKVLDLDHDGNPDVLSWVWTTAPGQGVPTPTLRAEGLLVDVEGHLIPAWSFELPTPQGVNCTYTGTAVGDFDGDGFDDFAICNWSDIHVYVTRAGEPPVLLTTIDISAHSNYPVSLELRAADLDGNGVADLVFANAYNASGFLSVGVQGSFQYLGQIDLGFSAIDPIVTVLDRDGDGRDEFVVRDVYPDPYQVFELSGTSLVRVQNYTGGMPYLQALVSGDIDGDGDEDMVAFDRQGPGTETYQVHRQVSPGVIQLEPVQQGGPATHLFDIDGDGDLDGVCCGGGPSCDWDNNAPSRFEICLNDGTGAFDFSVPFTGLATGADGLAGLADFDGDGDFDLVGGRCVLLNHHAVGASYCAPPANSTGRVGVLTFDGSASLSRADLRLRGESLPAGATVVVLLAGRADSVVVGSSELCLAAPLRRIGVTVTDPLGAVEVALSPTLFGATYPGAVAPGATRRFQLWHRDVGQGAFGFTEAGRVTFAP